MFRRALVVMPIALIGASVLLAHTPGMYLTWNKEVSRVFYARCAECHRSGGSAFSLMTYPEVQPHLTEIKNAVLNRRMPPWGAVKGFGDFRNDQGLTQEEISVISDWIDADAPKGNNPNVLPPAPKFPKTSPFVIPKNALTVQGDISLSRAFILDGFYPQTVPSTQTLRVVANFPDGHVEPLLWLYEYKDAFRHPFLLRKPMELPAGTAIIGVPSGAELVLLPGKPAKKK